MRSPKIMHRALPSAHGLKPCIAHPLHGMRLLRLDPGSAFKKSAKVVGDVMGSFHPHGDQAIYDALVRLRAGLRLALSAGRRAGQFRQHRRRFRRRLPLHRGAAHRGRAPADRRDRRGTPSTFARTTTARPDEPVVLPAAFPNLLANGSQGIAVGIGDLDPAAQRGGAVRRGALPHRPPGHDVRASSSPSCRGRTSPPAASSSRSASRSSRPTRPGAAAFACARAGTRRTSAADPGRWWSPRSPTASARRG